MRLPLVQPGAQPLEPAPMGDTSWTPGTRADGRGFRGRSIDRLLVAAVTLLATTLLRPAAAEKSASGQSAANLALAAEVSTSYVSGHETLAAVNDGLTPQHSDDKSAGAYGNWPRQGTQWVQYDWAQPVTTDRVEVYWFDDRRGVRLPKACRLLTWDGQAFVGVAKAAGLGLRENEFNVTTFPELTTTRLRLEFDGEGESSTGLLEWRVLDSGRSPNFAPRVEAGVDRVVVLTGATYLSGGVRDDGKPSAKPEVLWRQTHGPGTVTWTDRSALKTTARFSVGGDYILELAADDGELTGSDSVHVRVTAAPPGTHLQPVDTAAYRVSSPFWRPRLKNIVVNWIPYCVRKIEDPSTAEGGIGNFMEAGRKLAGATDVKHVGPVFANTWVYNTLESICYALMLDAEADEALSAAQAGLRRTMEDWIPKLLSAQEPDGYLHTMTTIQGLRRWTNRHDHEGYQAGYFMEAAVAHYGLTGGRDRRMLDAAQRLADCWVRNIGPAPKREWYEGHQELEMALVRLARVVEKADGPGQGDAYVALARYLLDARGGGDEYDQSHLPVVEQYEAVGHAVRAVYSYSGMADIAMATGDPDYYSAVQSLWDNIVNRKYYVTGGVGSGETAEGFGKDYSLPNHAYCETCAGCGELFFQHRLQRAYGESKYADLFEETLYNAILGGLDLEARNYTYTNPLDASGARYGWHVCPCCVGNISRTLLQLPSWTYAAGQDSVYVNLFVGSTVQLPSVAGVAVRMVQTTDYPWSGKVGLTVYPAEPKAFRINVRVPDRQVSGLYASQPQVRGLVSLAVNGERVAPAIQNGYAVLDRLWQPGDRIEWEVPMEVQRVKASPKVVACAGRVALRLGPLIYNLESVDQNVDGVLPGDASLVPVWRGDLLGGVLSIEGAFADGSGLRAVPNYARLNRGGRSVVWIRDE